MVTGANGFVGAALCAEAIRRGFRIVGATRSACELPFGVEQIIVGAIDGETDWIDALRGVDAVIHLAARVHVMRDMSEDPCAEFFKVNLHGTENLARQTASAGVKRFVFASSIKVNGESTWSPGTSSVNEGSGRVVFTEADIPNPQDPYSLSKWQAEQALRRIGRETGLEVVVVRPPLVYGPCVKGNFLSLLSAIEKGIPLPLSGANNVRSMVYVGNLVDALIACATYPSAAGQVYIACDGEAVSMSALAAKIADALGRPNRSFYLPPKLLRAAAALLGRTDQIDRLFGSLVVSDAKIRNELGWKPPYTLDQGLHTTTDWYMAQRPAVGYSHGTL